MLSYLPTVRRLNNSVQKNLSESTSFLSRPSRILGSHLILLGPLRTLHPLRRLRVLERRGQPLVCACFDVRASLRLWLFFPFRGDVWRRCFDLFRWDNSYDVDELSCRRATLIRAPFEDVVSSGDLEAAASVWPTPSRRVRLWPPRRLDGSAVYGDASSSERSAADSVRATAPQVLTG